jgi:hypothetical protein
VKPNAIERTVQKTHVWLHDIREDLPIKDERVACGAPLASQTQVHPATQFSSAARLQVNHETPEASWNHQFPRRSAARSTICEA